MLKKVKARTKDTHFLDDSIDEFSEDESTNTTYPQAALREIFFSDDHNPIDPEWRGQQAQIEQQAENIQLQKILKEVSHLITARRPAISGQDNEEEIKQDIKNLLTQLCNAEADLYNTVINNIKKALRAYVTFLKQEEQDESSSIFSDSPDEDALYSNSDSDIFDKKASAFIDALQKSAATDQRFAEIINAFIDDPDNQLKGMKYKAIPRRRAIAIPQNLIDLLSKIRPPSAAELPQKAANEQPKTGQNSALAKGSSTDKMTSKGIKSVVHSLEKAVKKTTKRIEKKPNTFLNPTLKTDIYDEKLAQIIALKKQIKAALTLDSSVITPDQAEHAKKLLTDYIQLFDALKNASLTSGQRKNLNQHKTREFEHDITLWMNKISQFIQENQQKEVTRTKLISERKKTRPIKRVERSQRTTKTAADEPM